MLRIGDLEGSVVALLEGGRGSVDGTVTRNQGIGDLLSDWRQSGNAAARIKRCMSLRVLLVVMIAAPILPTIVLAPVTLMRLGKDWPQLAPLGELVLIGIGARMLGGFVALAAAGWLIHATRAVSQAAAALGKGQSPPRTACGIAEIDAVLRSMARAARSLEQRSEEYQRAEAGRRESEARLRDFVESGSDWYWETDASHRFTWHSEHIRAFGQDPATRLGRARWELASSADHDPDKWRDHIALLERHRPFRNFRYTRKVARSTRADGLDQRPAVL